MFSDLLWEWCPSNGEEIIVAVCVCTVDDRRYGSLGRPDGTWLPLDRPAGGAPPGEDGVVCCGAQVPGPYSDHCLHTSTQGALCPACSGISTEGGHVVPEALCFRQLQRPHGPAQGLPGWAAPPLFLTIAQFYLYVQILPHW